MGSCTSKDSKVEKPKRKITNNSNPYQVPQQAKTEEVQLPKLSESMVQRPTTMSPSVRFLDGMSSLGVSRLKSTTTEVEPVIFKRPNIAPVLSKLKAKWDHQFTFDLILVKAKYRNLDDYPVGDEEVQGLWQEIGQQYKIHKWNNVKTFKFDLQGCRKLTDKSLETIAKEISRHFKSLETLVLSFEECAELTDKGVSKMFEVMCPHLTKVHRFEINFSRCFALTDKGLNGITYCISRYMQGLKNLSLTFNECNITEKTLKHIGKKVPRRATNLKKLNLTFNRCDNLKDDQNISLFSHKFNTLQNLILNFKDCRSLTDKSLRCFGTQIRLYLPTLRQLTLNYHQCFKITDDGLQQFQVQVRNKLKPLQKLNLDFGDCPALTHNGVEGLVAWIHNNLTNLDLLKLNFSKGEQLTNKTLEAVAERVSHLESLRSLTLTFSGNDLVNDKSLQAFGEKITKGLSKIRYLDLVFAHCNLITDNGFEALGNELKKLSGLQEIVLNFSGCEKITNKSLKLMESSMNKYYVNLRKVTVDMRGCKRVTYDVKDEVRYNWKFNARLEVF